MLRVFSDGRFDIFTHAVFAGMWFVRAQRVLAIFLSRWKNGCWLVGFALGVFLVVSGALRGITFDVEAAHTKTSALQAGKFPSLVWTHEAFGSRRFAGEIPTSFGGSSVSSGALSLRISASGATFGAHLQRGIKLAFQSGILCFKRAKLGQPSL